MKKILLVLPALVLFVSGCSFSGSRPTINTPNQTVNTNSQKFSEQAYFKNAYLISAYTLSNDAKMALTGFKMEKKIMPDGTTKIDLKALETQYHDQSYTLKNGEQLYFIDKFLGDDQGNSESNIGDDTAVIVSSDGVIVQSPATF
jgi:hypothetical protein